MIKGTVFDFDGTLFDSMPAWETLASDYVRSLGIRPEEDLDHTVACMDMLDAAVYLKKTYGIDKTSEDIIQEVNGMIKDIYADQILPKAGVKEFLDEMQMKHVRMCIATATDEHLIHMALKRCDMEKYFSAVYTCSSVGEGKESPKIYREALSHLGTDRSNTLVFEDAAHAAKTAHEDGFQVVGIYDASEAQQDQLHQYSNFYLNDFGSTNEFWKQVSAL